MTADRPIGKVSERDLESTRWIFFCMDVISETEKVQMPSLMGRGGIFMPHIETMKTPSNPGMLYQCEITPLRTRYTGVDRRMVPASELAHMATGYTTQDNGKEMFVGLKGKLEDYSKGSPEYLTYINRSNLAYYPVYPGDDILQAVRRDEPNGIGGIVELTELQGQEDATYIQYFFFPNWQDIQDQLAKPPQTIAEFFRHIDSRIQEIPNEPTEKQSMLRKTAAQMRSSAELYQVHGNATLNFFEASLKEMEKKNVFGIHYPKVGEKMLVQLNQKRKSDVMSGQVSAVDQLAEVMLNDRTQKNDLQAKELELRERELAVREAEVAARMNGQTVMVHPPADADNLTGKTVTVDGQTGIVEAVKTAGWLDIRMENNDIIKKRKGDVEWA